ncbi:MAG TPA: crosslink repair DNA glycosylase YcaQ family protein [Anaerolineaceae bacterium]|nr:crosslink repair DNA glycosylase YcaQ family protein [Anaerolineaceae bacterium]
MNNNIILNKQQAQQVMLASLGLLTPPRRKAGKADVLTAIRQIHNLQIDTISIVARAHQHILWSRLGSYQTKWLDELHSEGQLFEYFSHAVCLLPIEDYPLFRSLMLEKFIGWDNIRDWGNNNTAILDQILSHIHQNGSVRSSDFESKESRGTWWDWKVEKVALEHLYYRGDLMIARRESFQRVYDLRERVLPTWDDTQAPEYSVAVKELTRKAIKALGIASNTWAANYFYLKKAETAAAIEQLLAEGIIFPVSIEGVKGGPFFVHKDNETLLEAALANQLTATHTSILSPFDPLISDRARTKELFDFEYSIECYTPAPKRKYGYFILPILHRGRLIGRLDAKAWRKEGRLQVISLFLEPGISINAGLIKALAKTLRAYASWQGLDSVVIDWTDSETLRLGLLAHLKEG